MPCDVKLKLLNDTENNELTLATGVDESLITFDSVVQYITLLSKELRENLADLLLSALMISLTEKDVKDYNLVSNTSIAAIGKTYPILLPLIDKLNIDPTYNYTIIDSKKLMLNGKSYYGKAIDSNGKEVFFILGLYGAERFLNYIMLKSNINSIFKDKNTLIDEHSNYQKRLSLIAEKYKTTPKELLLKFLDDNKRIKSFKDAEGNLIVSQRIINELLNKIGGYYDDNLDKSDLYISLEAAKMKHDNHYLLKLNINSLYDCLKTQFNVIEDDSKFDINTSMELPSKEYFNKLSELDLNTFLHRLSVVDAKLYRAKFKVQNPSTTSEKKEKTVTKAEIESKWRVLRKTLKELNIELPTYKKVFDTKSKEEVMGFLNLAFSGDERSIIFKLDEEGNIVGNYIETKEAIKHVIIDFPWSYLGSVYNFGYESEYLWLPVKKSEDNSLDSDGKYKGMYIYEFYDPETKSTHFAVSRNIISPKSKATTFNTLEGAKNEIEKRFKDSRISQEGLWKMKMEKGNLRIIEVNESEITEDLLLTVLDLKLDKVNFNKMPTLFKDAFHGTLPLFYESFKNIEGIEKLDTPEKAAFFILDFYNKLRRTIKDSEDLTKLPINDVIVDNLELASDIIKEIENAAQNPITYRVLKAYNKKQKDYNESKKDKSYIVYVLKLPNGDGNVVDLSGKYSKGASINTINVDSLNTAANYFNDLFKLNEALKTSEEKNKKGEKYEILVPNFINILTRSELDSFNEERSLGLENNLNGIKAFVYNGRVIINSSTADMSDLYHEMSHIFLGVLKVKYPTIYQDFMNKYSKEEYFDKTYLRMLALYANFAELDILEETVVSLMANQMFKKQHLFDGFEGLEVVNDFNLIFNTFPLLATDMKKSGLEFTGFMQDLISKESSEIIRNMQISQLIKLGIDNKKITKNC